ncbi:MAG: DUF859 family phage minor structural protein [Actinobacteria bacterium]|nr:DUF859 family phage minor structural protein [Actinomycetota bacterium]
MAITYGPYYGTAVNGRQLAVTIIVDQDVASNTSTVREITQLISSNGSAAYSDQMLITNTINGAYTVWWQGYASYGAGTHTITDSYRVISHDANGNANATVVTGIQDTTGSFALSVTVTTLTLPNIPRGTTPSISGGGGFTTGAASTISLPRADSSYTHDVSYTFGSQSGTIVTGAGVSASWTPPHSLLTEIPNSATGTVDITVVTKQGATVIGSKKVGFTLAAGASVVPVVSAVAWTDQNPTVASAVGAFVQGMSLIKGAVTAAGAQGSAIVSKALTIAGAPVTESQVWQPTSSGAVVASGTATDSRGRSGSKAQNFTVLAYAPPTLAEPLVRRATSALGTVGDGEWLRLDLTAAVQSLKPAGVEKNALKLKVETKPSSGGAWTTRNNETHTGLSYNNTAVMVAGGNVFPLAQSFDVRITITDNLGQSATFIRSVGTGGASLDIAGTGTGHGKLWERGGIDVAGKGYFTDDVLVNDVALSKVGHTHAGTDVPAATTAARGTVPLASQAEADAGTDTAKAMTPKSVRDRGYAPWAMAAGALTTSTSGAIAVTLPASRFTQQPRVVAEVVDHPNVCVTHTRAVSATSFSLSAYTIGGGIVAAACHWQAVQMTSSSGSG